MDHTAPNPCDTFVAACSDTFKEMNTYVAGLSPEDRRRESALISEADIHGRVAARLGPAYRVTTQGKGRTEPDVRCDRLDHAAEFVNARRYTKENMKPAPSNYTNSIAKEWKWLHSPSDNVRVYSHRSLCLIMHWPGVFTFVESVTGFGKQGKDGFTRLHLGPFANFVRQKRRGPKTYLLEWTTQFPSVFLQSVDQVVLRVTLLAEEDTDTFFGVVVDTASTPLDENAEVFVTDDTLIDPPWSWVPGRIARRSE